MGHVLTRRRDWRARLDELMQRSAHRRFAWGVWDCATFAAAAVHALTGDDVFADYRGQYRTVHGAMRLMRSRGHETMHEALTAIFGEPVPPLQARAGDLVWVAGTTGEPALGVCTGTQAAVLTQDDVAYVRANWWTHCWRVG